MGNTSVIVIVVGVFSLMFSMLYFSSLASTNEVALNHSSRNATLEKAILIAEGLNETKTFKQQLENHNVSRQAVYITYNVSTRAIHTDNGDQIFLVCLDKSVLPNDTPMIMVRYGARLDIENTATHAVFIDPETNAVLHIHQFATTSG